MLAMGTASNHSEAAASGKSKEATIEDIHPPVPSQALLGPLVQPQPWTMQKEFYDESVSGSKNAAVEAYTAAAPFGGATGLELLDRQMHALHQQEHAHRLFVERAMAMPAMQHGQEQDQRLLHMRQMMEAGMRQQRARGPTNDRASAA